MPWSGTMRKKTKEILFLLVYLAVPMALYFVPIDWLNKQPPTCLFRNIFDFHCYGCGITRAIISGVQLDFQGAITYNRMIIVVFPLLFYVWLRRVLTLIYRTIFHSCTLRVEDNWAYR